MGLVFRLEYNPLLRINGLEILSAVFSFISLIEAFVQKGVARGTAIAFMMGVIGLSLPETTLLKKMTTW